MNSKRGRAFRNRLRPAVRKVAERTLWELASPSQKVRAGTKLNGVIKGPFGTDEKQTPYNDVTHYNNFYEFGVGKEEPAEKAKNFKTSPWTLVVDGAVNKPK